MKNATNELDYNIQSRNWSFVLCNLGKSNVHSFHTHINTIQKVTVISTFHYIKFSIKIKSAESV